MQRNINAKSSFTTGSKLPLSVRVICWYQTALLIQKPTWIYSKRFLPNLGVMVCIVNIKHYLKKGKIMTTLKSKQAKFSSLLYLCFITG